MDTPDFLCDRFAGAAVASQWRSLLELYKTIEQETASFCHAFDVHCPSGCGTCCEHFVPELTDAESSLIAAYLLYVKNAPAPVAGAGSLSGPCPLYDAHSDHHCTVYPVRGMICRLFGACPSENKGGFPVFRKCKYNEDAKATAKLGPEDFGSESGTVPTMQRYAVKFSSITDGSQSKPLGIAVTEQMNRLRFIAAYLDCESGGDDNGGTDPLVPTPNPLAS